MMLCKLTSMVEVGDIAKNVYFEILRLRFPRAAMSSSTAGNVISCRGGRGASSPYSAHMEFDDGVVFTPPDGGDIGRQKHWRTRDGSANSSGRAPRKTKARPFGRRWSISSTVTAAARRSAFAVQFEGNSSLAGEGGRYGEA